MENAIRQRNALKKPLSRQWTAVMIGNILLFVILAVSQPAFLQVTNLMNILGQCSLYGIMSIGMTFVISTGGIDISVGMNALFTMALMYKLNTILPAPAVFLIALLAGCLIGFFNGFMASVLNFPDMIATLASMSILRGAAYILLDNAQKFVADPLRVIGNSRVFGVIPTATLLMILMTVLGFWVLQYTRFGRYVLAVGGSKNSAIYTGLNVKQIRIGAYMICGFCAALGGIVYAGRIGSIAPDSGMGYEFTVITAVVLGGTKMSGGKSSVLGSVLGCLFLYLIENAMTMLEISSYYQVFARAVMMLCAIAIDTATSLHAQAGIVRERKHRILQI
ncbi:MAG TPA: ABC transporter permease [Clostridia bacterium]|nr:ABC transporter permease [Clostridia bacterium]